MDRMPTVLETRFMEVVSSYLPDLVGELTKIRKILEKEHSDEEDS